MAEKSVRPNEQMLRRAGLWPSNKPRHNAVHGEEIPAQLATVSRVFGEPTTFGQRTYIAISLDRDLSVLLQDVDRMEGEKQGRNVGLSERGGIAVIEVGEHGVRVRTRHSKAMTRVSALLTLAWNLYWLIRTVRK